MRERMRKMMGKVEWDLVKKRYNKKEGLGEGGA